VCVVCEHPIVAAGIRALLTETIGPTDRVPRFELVADHVDADVVVYDVFNLASGEDDDRKRGWSHPDGELEELVAARSAYSRIDVHTRSHAVAWAIEHGYDTRAAQRIDH
jgi:hypothetical protein